MIEPSGTRVFTIPGAPEKIEEMAANLLGLYVMLSLGEREVSALRLALDEAVTNAVKHGHQGDRTKVISVVCEWRPDAIVLTVTDQGSGFNCRRLPNPTCRRNLMKECGRGLYIITTIMTEVAFNDKGNEIRMTLRRGDAC